MLKPLLATAALLAALVPVVPATALPMVGLEAPGAPVVQVYGGCGPYGHRGPYGYCRPGGQLSPGPWRFCPPGWHLGRYGRRCWLN
ncbi:MAG: GCG_CRPN prefix-to-repeats domain-containing protein [Janthinobacterium lividum]